MHIKKRTVLSLEQALSLPYATWRFAHLGWRVIRIEATPSGDTDPGDPNRYIGAPVAGRDRSTYFLGQNAGKESLVLNLKSELGRALLHRLVQNLPVDVFCCNTLPSRYKALGVDFDSLKSINPSLVWGGISAMGPQYPDVPGYDPAIQAMVGYMELTGDPSGPPMLAGVPLTDLKAGDDLYAGVLAALVDAEPNSARRVDVSMLQAAASWLITTLPLLNFPHEPGEVSRSGNQHRKFIPSDVFKTLDGYLYMTVGNDLQWRRLVEIPKFQCCATPGRFSNAGRHRERKAMFADVVAVFARYSSEELVRDLTAAKIPWARVNDIKVASQLPGIAQKLTMIRTPDGMELKLQPVPVDIEETPRELSFPPGYGEHTTRILAEVGYSVSEIHELISDGIVYSRPTS